jgi:hypothetical protein
MGSHEAAGFNAQHILTPWVPGSVEVWVVAKVVPEAPEIRLRRRTVGPRRLGQAIDLRRGRPTPVRVQNPEGFRGAPILGQCTSMRPSGGVRCFP